MEQPENDTALTNAKPEEPSANRTAKDSLFRDLFRSPGNLLSLFGMFHPEMRDVKGEEIELITLHPVLMNLRYNDLGFCVRNKLIILVEAQSTWSINILIRLLLYLSGTYQKVIDEHKLNVFSSRKLDLPEVEFYVVYTGEKRQVRDKISLREDFFNNKAASLDLEAVVIHGENPENILGQYIIFCHVFNEQCRKYGYTLEAVKETVRICKSRNVLREYLDSRRTEEIYTMLDMLFDRDYIERAARLEGMQEGMQEGMREGVRALVESYQEIGQSFDKTAEKVKTKFNLPPEQAREYMDKYWVQ